MWPALSMTNPEPSAWVCCCWLGTGKPKNGSTLGAVTTCVAVTCTTPGAARRKIWFPVLAVPPRSTGLGPAARAGCPLTAPVSLSKPPRSAAPPSAKALPSRAAATSPPPYNHRVGPAMRRLYPRRVQLPLRRVKQALSPRGGRIARSHTAGELRRGRLVPLLVPRPHSAGPASAVAEGTQGARPL